MNEIRSPWDHLPPPVIRERRERPVHDPDAPKTKLGRKRKSTANYRQCPDDCQSARKRDPVVSHPVV
jgi:hypothetical protein